MFEHRRQNQLRVTPWRRDIDQQIYIAMLVADRQAVDCAILAHAVHLKKYLLHAGVFSRIADGADKVAGTGKYGNRDGMHVLRSPWIKATISKTA
jgi:hypothetical protein